MLRSDGSYDAVVRMSDIAELLYLVDTSCSHFADEILMSRLEMLSYRDCDAHGSIEAFGSFQRFKLRAEKLAEIEFHTGLAVAARDSDLVEIRYFA